MESTQYKDLMTTNLNDFIKVRLVERDSDKAKWVDIRRHWNGKPTKKGIILDLDSFNKLINIKFNI